MPSMANGRFFSQSTSISILTNISNEILLEIPIFDDDDQITLPFLIFIGTCGSIMSLKCLYAQRFRKNNSTYIFFFFIALVDLAILYTGALRLFVLALTGSR